MKTIINSKDVKTIYNYECIRDLCGYISTHTDSHIDNENWTRNLLLLKYFPEALDKFCKEYKDNPLYCTNYSELKNDLGTKDNMYDLDGKNVTELIEKGASHELSFDEINRIVDCLYINNLPTPVVCIATNLIKSEMHKYGFRV